MQENWIRLVYSQCEEKWKKGKTDILEEWLWVGWTGAWAEFFGKVNGWEVDGEEDLGGGAGAWCK